MINPNMVNQQTMMKMLENNPSLLTQFNQFLVNQNPNQQPQFPTSSTGEKSLRNMNSSPDSMRMMFDMDNPAPKVNIVFLITVGNKFNVIAPNTMKVKDLFINFITKLGFSTDIIGKDVFFVYNALRVDHNENRTINEMKIIDFSQIYVIDTKGVIGSK